MKKQVHEIRHDKIYKYVETKCQDNDNQDKISYSLKTHMERNKNIIYMHYMDGEKESKDTYMYVKKL